MSESVISTPEALRRASGSHSGRIMSHVSRLHLEKRRIVLVLATSFLIVLLLPLGIAGFNYIQSLRIVREQERANNQSMVDQLVYSLDQNMSEVEKMVQLAVAQGSVQYVALMSDPFEGRRVYRIYQAVRDLRDLRYDNPLLSEYYVCLGRPGVIITPDSAYHLDEFLERSLQASDSLRTALYDLARSPSASPVTLSIVDASIDGLAKDGLIYVVPIPYYGRIVGDAFVYIARERIDALFRSATALGDGVVEITNQSGAVIYCYQRRRDDNALETDWSRPERALVTTGTIATAGWQLVVRRPLAEIHDRAVRIQRTFTIVLVLEVVVGALLIIFFSFRHTLPLRRILSLLDGSGTVNPVGGITYDLIEKSASSVSSANSRLVARVAQQQSQIRVLLFQRLCHDSGSFSEEVSATITKNNGDISGRFQCVVVARPRSPAGFGGAELVDHRMALVSRLIELIGGESARTPLHFIDIEASLVIHVQSPADSRAEVERALCALLGNPSGRPSVLEALTFCIGSVVDGPAELHRSYLHAIEGVRALSDDEGGIVWANDVRLPNGSAVVPLEKVLRLEQLVLNGRTADVREWLAENASFDSLSPSSPSLTVDLVASELAIVLLRVASVSVPVRTDPSDYAGRLGRIGSHVNLHERLGSIVELIHEATKCIEESANDRKQSLAMRISAELSEGFRNPMVNLDYIADRCGISAVYLSQFMRENTGTSFSQHLEELRMAEARELLTRTSRRQKEIARMCGYASSSTFCRAFKRHHGLSPTEYGRRNT